MVTHVFVLLLCSLFSSKSERSWQHAKEHYIDEMSVGNIDLV